MSENILLFGGSFDPPHKGHQLPVTKALSLLNPYELWLVPCYDHMFDKQLSSTADRLAMCRLFAETINDRRVKVSTEEIDQQSDGSTFALWQRLHHLYPTTTFSFLIGSDWLPSFNQWKNWQELLKVMQFYVYLRAGYPLEPWFDEMKVLDSMEISNLSSTLVRERVKAGQTIKGLVPARVETYIEDRRLYK